MRGLRKSYMKKNEPIEMFFTHIPGITSRRSLLKALDSTLVSVAMANTENASEAARYLKMNRTTLVLLRKKYGYPLLNGKNNGK